jgi:hypothetical protein
VGRDGGVAAEAAAVLDIDDGQTGRLAARPDDAPSVDDVLAGLAVTAHELADAFVLDRNPTLRDQLADWLELLDGPYDRLSNGLRSWDLLVRGAVGEGHAMVALLVDGEVLGRLAAERQGWELEGSLPGRYALVTEGGSRPRTVGDWWARRIADQYSNVPVGQALLRRTGSIAPAGSVPVVGWKSASTADLSESITATMPALQSPLFVGDTDLDAVLHGTMRLAAPGISPWPAPVLSAGPAIVKVQKALIALGYPLPRFGADGRFGPETGSAVARYKTDRGIQPNDPVIGRLTITALDTGILACDHARVEAGAPLACPRPPVDPQVHYTDRKSYYTNIALRKAQDSSHPDWDPAAGWAINRPRVVDVYGYYRDLAVAQPETFLWAGLGHMAGGAVVGGWTPITVSCLSRS